MTTSVTRFVVTHLDRNGYRTFAHHRQGRDTYETRAEAEKWIEAAHNWNGLETLARFYGLPLEVRACECYPGHFDPQRIIPEEGDK